MKILIIPQAIDTISHELIGTLSTIGEVTVYDHLKDNMQETIPKADLLVAKGAICKLTSIISERFSVPFVAINHTEPINDGCGLVLTEKDNLDRLRDRYDVKVGTLLEHIDYIKVFQSRAELVSGF